jgi:DnaK suppressor protein
MKKSDIEKLKGMLEQQLRVLQADAGNLHAVSNSAALADVNDQATLESERSFELRIKDRERKLIGKVQDALRKMADGSYGICESCGEPISVKRLQARPVTTYCINCKAEQEAEEKREEVLAQSSERAL